MAEGQEPSLVVMRGGSHQAHAAQPSTNYSAVCRAILISYFLSGKHAAVLGTGPGQRPGGQGRNLPVTDQSLEMGTFQGGKLLYPHFLHTAHAYREGDVLPWLCWSPDLESDSVEFKSSLVSSWRWHQLRACL